VFISYRKVCDLIARAGHPGKMEEYLYGKLNSMLINKQFPLPVKDTNNQIAFIKNEVDAWLIARQKKRTKKNG
jgi:predicted DNA-binding transcriptional regulator AlpA